MQEKDRLYRLVPNVILSECRFDIYLVVPVSIHDLSSILWIFHGLIASVSVVQYAIM